MIIVGHLLGFEGDTANTFEVVIQLGLDTRRGGDVLACRLFGLIGIRISKPPAHEGQGSGRLSLFHILLGTDPLRW